MQGGGERARRQKWDINCTALGCRIFQFENFVRTKKRALARELEGGAMVGGRGRGVVCG